MDNEPEVVRFVAGPWSEPKAHRAFIEQRTRGPWPAGLGYWSIEDEAACFLGWVLLIPLDGVGPEVEIGWRLRRSAWCRGIATEAARPVLQHGFQVAGLTEIVAPIDPENLASIRVAEKIGLRRDGLVRLKGRELARYAARKPGTEEAPPSF